MAETILIVDDSPAQCEALKEILEKEGYRVFTAETIKEALKIVKAEKPDLALIDLILSETDNGVELFKKIREKDPDFKAIIYTGYGPEEEVGLIVDAVHEGMIDEFLRKPMAADEIIQAVKKHI
jgi:two-component system response regulator (stage 0 sporulation protein F)